MAIQYIQMLWDDTDLSAHISDSVPMMLLVKKIVGEDTAGLKNNSNKSAWVYSGSAPERQSSRNSIKTCLLTSQEEVSRMSQFELPASS